MRACQAPSMVEAPSLPGVATTKCPAEATARFNADPLEAVSVVTWPAGMMHAWLCPSLPLSQVGRMAGTDADECTPMLFSHSACMVYNLCPCQHHKTDADHSDPLIACMGKPLFCG